jgi:hypothetical protein
MSECRGDCWDGPCPWSPNCGDADYEIVGWVTVDILASMKRGERAVPGWKRSLDFCIPLYVPRQAERAASPTEGPES